MAGHSAPQRTAAELRQGVELAREGAEHVWGWTGAAGSLRAERRARYLAARAGLGPGVDCLEVGAGTGLFTERLAASGARLVAVELSPETAAVCRRRVGDAAEVVVGNIETGEGLAGRTFDAVVGVSVLHHVDLEAALATIRGLLRPDGRFAFSEPNVLNPQVWAERNVEWLRKRRRVLEHERAFTAAGLRQAFERAGLQVDESEPFDFLHPATPARLVTLAARLGSAVERSPFRSLAGSVRIAGRRPPD